MENTNLFFWFIGLFEGEGSFSITKNKAKKITITSTDRDVLEKVQLLLGGNIVMPKIRNEKWKQEYVWYLNKNESKDIILKMLPFLSSRRRKRANEWLVFYDEQLKIINERLDKKKYAIENIHRLREEGFTHKQIADKLGYERSHISKMLKQF